LIITYLSGDFGNVTVERPADVVVIAEDKCLLEIETNSDDIASILLCECPGLFRLELMLKQELFIVCDESDDRWAAESVKQLTS
jgi:hypothetical protein